MKTAGFVVLLLLGRPLQDPPLRDQIEGAVKALKLKDAKVGLLVYSVKGNRTLYASNDREPFRLASNTKLLTTSTALCRLGADFKFRTAVGLVGADLHVFGGGDPNISGRFHDDDPTVIFKGWAAKIKAAGVTKVGNLVLHTGIFDGEHVNPGWKGYDPWPWWAAPFGALSLNDNCVDLKIEPGAEGEPCRVTLAPDTAYVTINNRTKTAAKPARPFAFSRPAGTNVITFRGEVGPQYSTKQWCSVHDPTMFFGAVLREVLARSGIEVSGKIEESDELLEDAKGFRELAFWESDLPTTLAACNQPSQNFYAEMILRTLGWKLKGKGTLENGLAVTRDFCAKELGLEQVSQADGSGLTPENLASPADLVRLLIYMRGHKHAKEFVDSLPASGTSPGTLRKRMTAADLKGRVRAKTGHIEGVSSLSGYAESAGGDTFVFSILFNGASTAPADRFQDHVCELLVRSRGE